MDAVAWEEMREPKPIIVITHASFDEQRHISLMRLVGDLRAQAPTLPFVIVKDEDRKGSLWCWRRAMEEGLRAPWATHVVWLPDDAIVCEDFGAILLAAIAARPNDVFDCFVNHPLFRTHEVETCWYSTSDGYTGVGGVMPRDLLTDHLKWRDERPELGRYPNDAGVNMWAIDRGRRIFKTAWSLVQHDADVGSLDGHDNQPDGIERVGMRPIAKYRTGIRSDVMNLLGRTFSAPEAHLPGRRWEVTDLGPTYASNMFDMVRVLEPKHWNLGAMYRACHEPLETKEHVVVIVPEYHEDSAILQKTRPSREAVAQDLEEHGISCSIITPPTESHVDRMRQRATHLALKMGATHILWWDADIECLTPTCVRAMLSTGHDVVAGACPFKAHGGHVVCNVRDEDERVLRGGKGTLNLERGCLEVYDAGTGFMLIKRELILALMQANPELCYLSRGRGDKGEPLWAIWDASLVGSNAESWADTVASRCFETEDWFFCRLVQDMGKKVHIFIPAKFKHWGLHGYEGSFEHQWGLTRAG